MKTEKELQMLGVLKQIYDLIHPDTTPDGGTVTDGAILDMVYDLVAPIVEGETK